MDEFDPREWTPSERNRLAALKDVEPPHERLRAGVVNALREEGWIRSQNPPRSSWSGWRSAAAASLVFFLLGWGLRPLVGSRFVDDTSEPRFLLLLIRGETDELPAVEVSRRVREYSEWAQLQREAGALLAGEKLAVSGIELRDGAAAPLAQSDPGRVEGYFLIRASNEPEATRIARTCPHLRYGGIVEVRRLE